MDDNVYVKLNLLAKQMGKEFRPCIAEGCFMGIIARYTADQKRCKECNHGIVLKDIK